MSYTVYAPFTNPGAYRGHYKCAVCLFSNTAFCAYFGDKNNFLAMFLPLGPTKTEEIELNFTWILDQKCNCRYLMNSFQVQLIHSSIVIQRPEFEAKYRNSENEKSKIQRCFCNLFSKIRPSFAVLQSPDEVKALVPLTLVKSRPYFKLFHYKIFPS